MIKKKRSVREKGLSSRDTRRKIQGERRVKRSLDRNMIKMGGDANESGSNEQEVSLKVFSLIPVLDSRQKKKEQPHDPLHFHEGRIRKAA